MFPITKEGISISYYGCLTDVRPIGEAAKEGAFTQVINYFRQNQAEMRRVIQMART